MIIRKNGANPEEKCSEASHVATVSAVAADEKTTDIGTIPDLKIWPLLSVAVVGLAQADINPSDRPVNINAIVQIFRFG
jgi:hypothetical protein